MRAEVVALRPRPYGDGQGDGANSVLGKARLILEAFRIDDTDLSLSELSRRTGISKATVHRLAQELLDWGMLERSGSDYRLGMRAFELGSRVPRFRVLRDAVRPFMENLHALTRETVHLAVLDGLEVLFLEKIADGPRVAHQSRIAGRMPLHCTATLLDEVLARPLERRTPSTIVLPNLVREQIRKAREAGHALETEETAIGYCSTAVPLFGSSGILLGALAITAPSFRANTARYLSALMTVSRKLAATDHIN
jgi:DNA-binding IclR family transcriptional regulator